MSMLPACLAGSARPAIRLPGTTGHSSGGPNRTGRPARTQPSATLAALRLVILRCSSSLSIRSSLASACRAASQKEATPSCAGR